MQFLRDNFFVRRQKRGVALREDYFGGKCETFFLLQMYLLLQTESQQFIFTDDRATCLLFGCPVPLLLMLALCIQECCEVNTTTFQRGTQNYQNNKCVQRTDEPRCNIQKVLQSYLLHKFPILLHLRSLKILFQIR